MDFPQIGAHCSLASCNTLDFLPITCQCDKTFCNQHISADLHDCPALKKFTVVSSSTSPDPLQRCHFAGCQKPRLRIYNSRRDETCSACHQSFCVEHRHPEIHLCSSTAGAPRSPLTQVSSSTTSRSKLPSRPPPTDPVKLAQWQKMELIKIRHRASPADPKDKGVSLPPDERLHVKILLGQDERIFWFRKTVVTGRALDLIVGQLKLSFPDNQSLKLRNAADDEAHPTFFRNDQLLANQVKDGDLLVLHPV